MINILKYFNEICIKNLEKKEDEFINNPTGIASYVVKVGEELEKLGVKIIQETLEEIDRMIRESPARKENWVVERSYEKELITSLGRVCFKKTLYTNKNTGETACLLDRILDIDRNTRLTEDAVANILKESVQTSYSRGGENVSIGKTSVSKQTVKNILHDLEFPEEPAADKKKRVDYLYIDADEDHVSLQFNEHKGDLTRSGDGRKDNGFITKLAYIYEGVEKEAPRSKRHKLINPHYFCGSTESETNEEFWNRIYRYIEDNYETEHLKGIYLNGDGGSWIKGSRNSISGITFVLDEFHMKKHLTSMTSHMAGQYSEEGLKDIRKTINGIIKSGTKAEFRNTLNYLIEHAGSDREVFRITESGEYFLSNWMAARNRLADREHVKGCSAEGHVSHVLSERMSTKAMGWSRTGATQMAKLRAYSMNGGDMLELAKYQKEKLPKAAGAGAECILSASDIARSMKNRHGMLGKYYESMPKGTLHGSIKKKLAIQHHIAGL